jgi:hypothetical protein
MLSYQPQAPPPLDRVLVNHLCGTPHPILHVQARIEEAHEAVDGKHDEKKC